MRLTARTYEPNIISFAPRLGRMNLAYCPVPRSTDLRLYDPTRSLGRFWHAPYDEPPGTGRSIGTTYNSVGTSACSSTACAKHDSLQVLSSPLR